MTIAGRPASPGNPAGPPDRDLADPGHLDAASPEALRAGLDALGVRLDPEAFSRLLAASRHLAAEGRRLRDWLAAEAGR